MPPNYPPEVFVAETSNLLQKSLSNGSLPSHEDLHKDFEVQLQTIHKKGCDGKPRVAFQRNLLVLFLGGLSMALGMGVLIRSAWNDEGIEPEGVFLVIDDDPELGDRFPLSRLDPVRHLNMAQHGRDRWDPAFPSYYYGSTDDDDPPVRALPTNAWYQNMLQAPLHGEPVNLQRIYPGPYLLDVVGSIPGLRIHATDTVSSDMVMQLTFNERFGLVLGATESLSSSSQDAHTKRYKVLKTTDLGLTLEWVSKRKHRRWISTMFEHSHMTVFFGERRRQRI